ncbi:MAG: type VI secretion system tube protein Hcp [Candidatus Bathyarchaeota archaeon]|nr:type VI secretion system tube protein Hcp [Candidatus Bathyarchaeota archaeon]
MRRNLRNVFLVFLVVAALATIQMYEMPVEAAFDPFADVTGGFSIYGDFDGISGESTDKDHVDWIDVLSFSFSVTQPTSSTGTTRRRSSVVMGASMTKYVDKATPKLMEKCASGEVIPEVTVVFTRTFETAVEFYQYDLTNVMVVSYRSSGDVTSDWYPWDSLSLRFKEIKVTYTEYDSSGMAKGNVEWNYNIELGE